MAVSSFDRLTRGQAIWPAFDGFDLPTLQGAAQANPVLALARQTGAGIVLDTCTPWAGQAGGERLGLSAGQIALMNASAVAFALGLRAGWPDLPCVINGMVGPAQDAQGGQDISAWHARMAHSAQLRALAEAGADMVTATGMTHVAEAIGIAGAAAAMGLPCVVSFRIDPLGRLPSGQPLDEAIHDIDLLDVTPLCYGVEGADLPATLFDPAQDWVRRIGALRLSKDTDLAGLVPRLPELRMIGASTTALLAVLSSQHGAARALA